MDESGFVIPPTIENDEQNKKIYTNALEQMKSLYKSMTDAGIPGEDARFILPNACKTNIVMTMNLRELSEVSKVRMCNKAQWEIKELFQLLKKEVLSVEPFLGTFMKAKCKYLGHCPEIESCGKMSKKN